MAPLHRGTLRPYDLRRADLTGKGRGACRISSRRMRRHTLRRQKRPDKFHKGEDTMTEREKVQVDMKLEQIVIPVSDVDRAKEFYEKLGWRLDIDIAAGDFR